jgi:hypothetical protein
LVPHFNLTAHIALYREFGERPYLRKQQVNVATAKNLGDERAASPQHARRDAKGGEQ